MKALSDVLIRPLITEKGTNQTTDHNQYAFEVASDATKIDIANAVRQIYKVQVVKVQTLWVKGRPKRLASQRRMGRTSNWKKAVVRLAPGQQISDATQ